MFELSQALFNVLISSLDKLRFSIKMSAMFISNMLTELKQYRSGHILFGNKLDLDFVVVANTGDILTLYQEYKMFTVVSDFSNLFFVF